MLATLLSTALLVTPAAAPARPPIAWMPIPYPASRKREMSAYSQRHYGHRGWRLRRPRVIVEHTTQSSTVSSAYNTFAPDVPDNELHELPGTCAHFVIGRDGRIFQFVPVGTMCRHTVGLNDVAIGIEHVAFADGDVLGDAAQLQASLALTRWLRCRFAIPVTDVIGHAESLSSRFHHERVARLRRQTHGDWMHASMVRYRRLLSARGCR